MKRPLYGWLAAESVSLTGTRVSMVALPLFALETTGSAALTGLVALAEMLPLVLCKLLAGPLIDRVGARLVAISCDVASVAAMGAIPLLHHLDVLSFPVLLLLVAIAGALRGPGDGAKHAFVPTLVDEAGVPMERATGLHSTVERTAGMVGAGVAGLLVVAIGAADTLLVNAATFGVSAMVLAWATAPLSGTAPTTEVSVDDVEEEIPYLRQLREGWDFLRHEPVLLGITVMVAITNLFDAAWSTVLMPVWSVESGAGAGVLGLLFAVMSGFSALGALVAATVAERLPRFRTYLLAFLICGAPRFVVLAIDAPLVAVFAVFAVAGFASGFINPVLGAVIFERIPRPLVGRVSSLSTSMCWALMPFGGLLAGGLIGLDGLAFALVIVGVGYFAATMLPALDPRWRDLDRRPGSPPIGQNSPSEGTTAPDSSPADARG